MELLKLFKRPAPDAAKSRAAVMLARTEASAAIRGRVLLDPWARPQTALPPELAAFRPIRMAQLEPGRRQALVKVFQNIPKPTPLVSRLLCPEFVARGSLSELVEVIQDDRELAGQLLTDINSPAYGLRLSIDSVEQAVATLGATTVRGLSLHRLLMRSFKADSPERQRLLETTGQASVLASELGVKLAKGLGYAEPGALLSCIMLSFVGRLSTVAVMPRRLLEQVPARGYLARASAEQAVFGLSAAEIGRLLMGGWGLPEAVVDEAAEVEAVLFAPYAAWEPERASRLALCYLSVRLGERLAQDAGSSLDDFDLLDEPAAEFHHVRAYLKHPGFAAVDQALGQPALRSHIDRLRLALLTPRPFSS